MKIAFTASFMESRFYFIYVDDSCHDSCADPEN